MEVLQTSALPLGYAALRKGKTLLMKLAPTVNENPEETKIPPREGGGAGDGI